MLAQHVKNTMAARPSYQVGWKRGSFESWKIPSASKYCMYSESESPLVQQESLRRVNRVLIEPK